MEEARQNTDLMQVTDKPYHIKQYRVHLEYIFQMHGAEWHRTISGGGGVGGVGRVLSLLTEGSGSGL